MFAFWLIVQHTSVGIMVIEGFTEFHVRLRSAYTVGDEVLC